MDSSSGLQQEAPQRIMATVSKQIDKYAGVSISFEIAF